MIEISVEAYPNFKCLLHNKRELSGGHLYLYEHIKTSVKIAVLVSQSEEEFLSVGIDTPVNDDRGIAHIVEHCILCGSEKYSMDEVQAFFFNEKSGSTANGIVHSKLTQFCVKSLRHKDFIRGVNICLDSIFYPLFIKDESIFLQEGWHIRKNGNTCEYGGVVYNEMVSRLSDIRNQISLLIRKNLCNSGEDNLAGGIPDELVRTKYSDIKEYYYENYKVSNMNLFLKTKSDNIAECLELINTYLMEANTLVDSSKKDKPFEDKIKKNHFSKYDTLGELDLVYATYNYNIKMSSYFAIYRYLIAVKVIRNCLEKKYKNSAKGKATSVELWSNLMECYPVITFAFATKQENILHTEEEFHDILNFLQTDITNSNIQECIDETVKNLCQIEKSEDWEFFSYALFLYWKMDGSKDFLGVDFASIIHDQGKILLDWYENQYEKDFTTSIPINKLVFFPQEYKASEVKFDSNMIWKPDKKVRRLTKPENSISFSRENILGNKNYREHLMQQCKVISENVYYMQLKTGGNVQIRFMFDASTLPKANVHYASMFVAVLNSFLNENRVSKLVSVSLETYYNHGRGRVYICFSMNIPAQYTEQFAKVLNEQIIRIKKMSIDEWNVKLLEHYRNLGKKISQNKHLFTVYRTLKYCSEDLYLYECTHGITCFNQVKEVIDSIKKKPNVIMACIQQVYDLIFQPQHLFITYAAEDENQINIKNLHDAMIFGMDEIGKCNSVHEPFTVSNNVSEGFVCNINTSHVAFAVNLPSNNVQYDGKAKLIKKYLNEELLPQELRRNNGVYSYSCSVIPTNGNFYMMSYFDPNIKDTLHIFHNIDSKFEDSVFVRNFVKNQFEILENENFFSDYLSEERWLIQNFFSGLNAKDVKAEMREIQTATVDSMYSFIQKVADVLRLANYCVFGNHDVITENVNLFGNIFELSTLDSV